MAFSVCWERDLLEAAGHRQYGAYKSHMAAAQAALGSPSSDSTISSHRTLDTATLEDSWSLRAVTAEPIHGEGD